MAPLTTSTLVSNFTALYPEIMPSLRALRFIEQYDPLDESAESTSQPYAYVADFVQEVQLGVDIDEVRSKGVGNDAWSSMVELRDKLAPGEKIAWFVVVCGDVERWAPPTVGLLEGSNGVLPYVPMSVGSGGSVDSSYDKRFSAEVSGCARFANGCIGANKCPRSRLPADPARRKASRNSLGARLCASRKGWPWSSRAIGMRSLTPP